MSPLPLYIGSALSLLAILIQILTPDVLTRTASLRRQVMASRERCPTIANDLNCAILVSARSYGEWTPCDAEQPPSGADLPMHRWFQVRATCDLQLPGVHIKLPIPTQLIYR